MESFCRDVGLKFGFTKCATDVSKRGHKGDADTIETTFGKIMPQTSSYKYLGMKQNICLERDESKQVMKDEPHKRNQYSCCPRHN